MTASNGQRASVVDPDDTSGTLDAVSDAQAPPTPDPSPAPNAPPAPEFTVLGVRAVEHAAAPTLSLALGVSEPAGREVFAIALRAQIQFEPAQRSYTPETKALLSELFGAPERWAATAHSLVWAVVDVMVPSFTGTGTFEIPVPCTYDLELAATKYLYALGDGEAPLSLHFSGSVFYPAEQGRMQMAQIPWSTTARFELPVQTWKRMIAGHYPDRGWVALSSHTLERLYRRKAERGATTFDACLAELLDEAGG
ncbi:MAG TPA: DUF6084 family protein [Solirubrobacteraceae bacterium]